MAHCRLCKKNPVKEMPLPKGLSPIPVRGCLCLCHKIPPGRQLEYNGRVYGTIEGGE